MTNRASITLWVALCALAIVNVLLIRQNLQMRAEISRSKPAGLEGGDTVPGFVAQGLRGEPISISYTGKEATRVLLYFTPSCPYCQEQFPYWQEIISRANANHFQVLGLVSESEDRAEVEQYLRGVGCETLRVAFAPRSVFIDYKLSVTPTTVVVTNDGIVEQAWVGKWDSESLDAARSIFGLPFSTR
jgi:peroxiredoxin